MDWITPIVLMISLVLLVQSAFSGLSAVRAVYRELRGQNNWEKTIHLGAHRQYKPLPPVRWERSSSLSR